MIAYLDGYTLSPFWLLKELYTIVFHLDIEFETRYFQLNSSNYDVVVKNVCQK